MSARAPDAGRLAALHAEAFATPWTAEDLAALAMRPGAVLEAESDGFVLLQGVGDEAEVLTLAVRPAARRQGVGGRLMRRALARATEAGVARVFLEVAEDNDAAQALYARLGFAATGRRRAYYDRGAAPRVDALLLVLNLPERLG
ncbi:ribosomal protein S18-alanine N-acetyltransferase [Brevundimonas sp.]|uniref:ribosomal protein S18-alanine N-acetyltransferase n=1 Tax=Brevundimonas sp. TaxID=1871086 RepID=UPI002608B292|nr:ribosomal protein S18-alanine N-acetyltransferase [Brevundimonas sp.]